ncbi:MAG TPA: hypothetical protein VHH35_21035 [Pyrinomonadaceae bacterium]|nr:hypothetical protein [Pyrinomonadaceae bacterium]
MSAISESVTWKSWSQKWGDWTTWFPKAGEQSSPSASRPQQHRVEPVRKARKLRPGQQWFVDRGMDDPRKVKSH